MRLKIHPGMIVAMDQKLYQSEINSNVKMDEEQQEIHRFKERLKITGTNFSTLSNISMQYLNLRKISA